MTRTSFLTRHPLLLLLLPVGLGLAAAATSLRVQAGHESTGVVEIAKVFLPGPLGAVGKYVEEPEVVARRVTDVLGSAYAPDVMLMARRLPNTDYVEIVARGHGVDRVTAALSAAVGRLAAEHETRVAPLRGGLRDRAAIIDQDMRRLRVLARRAEDRVFSPPAAGVTAIDRDVPVARLYRDAAADLREMQLEKIVLDDVRARESEMRTRLVGPVSVTRGAPGRLRMTLLALGVALGAVGVVAGIIVLDQRARQRRGRVGAETAQG